MPETFHILIFPIFFLSTHKHRYIVEMHSVLFSMKKSLKVPKNTVVNHLKGQCWLDKLTRSDSSVCEQNQ